MRWVSGRSLHNNGHEGEEHGDGPFVARGPTRGVFGVIWVEVDDFRIEVVWFGIAGGTFWGGVTDLFIGEWLCGHLHDLRVLLEIPGV